MASQTPLSWTTTLKSKLICKYEGFLTRVGVKHLVTLIEHPQTNDQAKASNRVILKVLCTRLDMSKGLWKEKLASILLTYHCSPQTATNETHYRLI